MNEKVLEDGGPARCLGDRFFMVKLSNASFSWQLGNLVPVNPAILVLVLLFIAAFISVFLLVLVSTSQPEATETSRYT